MIEAEGVLFSHADDGASSARQKPDSPATTSAGNVENEKPGFETKAGYRRAMQARKDGMREARQRAKFDRLQPSPKLQTMNRQSCVIAALAPFLWLGDRIGLNLSAILRRARKKRRAKERQRRRGGRAFQLRKELQRMAKKQAIFTRLAQQRREDRQPQSPHGPSSKPPPTSEPR